MNREGGIKFEIEVRSYGTWFTAVHKKKKKKKKNTGLYGRGGREKRNKKKY